MRTFRIATLALVTALAACSHGAGTSTASPSPSEAAPTSSASAAASPSPAESGSATPEPTPTPNPNMLSFFNGAYVRSYTKAVRGNPDDFAEHGVSEDGSDAVPATVVWELPGVETLTSFKIWLGASDEGKKKYTATIAVSTTGPDSGFSDVGTVSSSTDSTTPTIDKTVQARWVRATLDGPNTSLIGGLYAYGSLPSPRASNAPISATMIERSDPYKESGAYNGTDISDDPWFVHVTQVPGGITITRCADAKYGDTRPGTFDGRTWTFASSEYMGHGIVNDEGTIITGADGGSALHLTAAPTAPAFCTPRVRGNGPNRIVVLDSSSVQQMYPLRDEDKSTAYTFTRVSAGMLDPQLLSSADMVIFNGICVSADYLSPMQDKLLDDWVSAGHKVGMYDSDMCGEKTEYAFLPYQFHTSNPGAGGAHGKRLIEVESNELGSLDQTDKAHYFNATAYQDNESNQLGDANTTLTKDDHWCGHLFGTNSQQVNGFMQMYARYGQGVFIYDGFDHDDSDLPEYQRVRDLEFALKPPGDLPCNAKADLSFVLQPDRDASFTAGTAKTMPFDMEVLANQGWKGHVTVSATGSFPATVTPSAFDMTGGTQPLKITVSIPRTATAGTYTTTVIADDGAGHTSQAVITLNATAPLKLQIKKQKRIRIYGIHFDYDSAHIQPRSEPVVKQIADLMNQDKSVRFRVEGHTDSDGGADYNLKLSQRRAQAVVDDLVNRYHIARSRLQAQGFGLTRPVAPNTTAGGKALNRRVELVVL